MRSLRFFETASADTSGMVIPSLQYLKDKLNANKDKLPDYCKAASEHADKYLKLYSANDLCVDCTILDPRVDENKFFDEKIIEKSYGRLQIPLSKCGKRDFISELTSPENCNIQSTPWERAIEGSKNINDFLTNPKFQRRRQCLLSLHTATVIERGNVQIRNSYKFNQSLMSDPVLSSKLIIRCSESTLVYHKIKEVLRVKFEVQKLEIATKKAKIDETVKELMKELENEQIILD